eukprot:RCo029883
MSDAEVSESEMLVAKVAGGDLAGLKEVLEDHPGGGGDVHTKVFRDKDGTEGPLLNLAVHHDHGHVVSFLFEQLKNACGGSAKAASEKSLCTFFAFQEGRHRMVEHLLAMGASPNLKRPSDGNTLLHLCCDRRKPLVRLARAVLQAKGCDPNIPNANGDMPVHLLAMKCNSPGEGRDVLTLLKMKGARLDATSGAGKTAMQLTQNAHIRQALGFASSLRQRELPQLTPEEQGRETIDHIMKTEVETPRELLERRTSESASRKAGARKLTAEDQEELNRRLVTVPMEAAKRRTEQLLQKYVRDPDRTVLTAEELERFATRHYYDQVEAQNVRMSQLTERYVTEMVPSSQLTEEEMQASVQRLHNESMAHTAATIQKLVQQYVRDVSEELATNPPSPFVRSPKKAPRAQLEKACQDMYQRSMEASKKHAEELMQRYVPEKLVQCKTLTQEEHAASGERLYKSYAK